MAKDYTGKLFKLCESVGYWSYEREEPYVDILEVEENQLALHCGPWLTKNKTEYVLFLYGGKTYRTWIQVKAMDVWLEEEALILISPGEEKENVISSLDK